MATVHDPGEVTGTGSPDLKAQIEDYALTAVPLTARRSGWGLLTNTAGIVSTLVQLAIGGGVTIIAGVGWGIVAGVLTALFGGTLGWLVGHVAYRTGMSSTVTARTFGLGSRGSIVGSLIYSFMITGFLALEDALLYHGTLFMFGWQPSAVNAIAIYGVLTLVWIALTTFGLKLVQRTSTVLLIAFVVLTVVLAGIAVAKSGMSLTAIITAGPVTGGSGAPHLATVIAILAGPTGSLALTDADFARYARSSKDVGILAVGGAIMMDIVTIVVGCFVVRAGAGAIGTYLRANPAIAASQQGASITDKVSWMVDNNPGAYFIVLAGLIGFLLMYVAQAKAQVLNTYSGSLSLSNLVDGLFGRNVGRLAMVVLANVIGLLMIAGNILGLINRYLGALGVITTALAGVIIADYYLVRRRPAVIPDRIESVNWAGVVSVVLSSVTGGLLTETGVTPLGFLVTLGMVLVLYPVLRRYVLRERLASS